MARKLAPEALRQLEAGESANVDDLPVQAVIGPYIRRHKRWEAEWAAEEAARQADEAQRAEEQERQRREYDATWGNREWLWEQQQKAEQTGDWQLWLKCEQQWRLLRKRGILAR
jgi:hypothetical protein